MKTVLLATLGALLAAGGAQAACGVDDANQPDSTDTWVVLIDAMEAAQTFEIETSGTGLLDEVVLYFAFAIDAPHGGGPPTDTVHVSIRDVVSGAPGPNVLATVSEALDTWSTSGGFIPGFRTFDFSAAAIDADQGEELAIVVRLNGSDQSGSQLKWAGGWQDPYARGKAFSREDGSASWDDIDATPAQTDRAFAVTVCR